MFQNPNYNADAKLPLQAVTGEWFIVNIPASVARDVFNHLHTNGPFLQRPINGVSIQGANPCATTTVDTELLVRETEAFITCTTESLYCQFNIPTWVLVQALCV